MDVLMGSFAKFSLKLYFEMVMDGTFFSRTPIDDSEWMKKTYRNA